MKKAIARAARRHTPRATPTPMPALAPVERPLDGVVPITVPVGETAVVVPERVAAAPTVDADGLWPGSIWLIVVGPA